MKNNDGIGIYRTIDLETSDNIPDWDKINKLFEGLIYSLSIAKNFMKKKDISKKCVNISKAISIIENGLIYSLDFDKGQNIAQELLFLYRYMVIQLMKANLFNDDKIIDHVIFLIKNLSYAWKKIKPTI